MKWSAIKSFYHNPIIKVSYIIVIGLPLFFEISTALGKSPKLPWGVFLLFFSSLFLLIAAILYFVFCPPVIKDYKNLEDYKANKKPDLLAKDKADWGYVVMTHLDETQTSRRNEIEMLIRNIAVADNQSKLNSIYEELYPSCVIAYLEKEYDKNDKQFNKIALIVCYVLLSLGTLMVLWVFGERIKIVLENLPIS